MKNPILDFFQKTVATVAGIGYFPFMSGTIASIATVAGVYYLTLHTPVIIARHFHLSLALFALGATVISIISSMDAERLFGTDDPSAIVIDEVAGQLIAFLLVPITWQTLVMGLLLFRLFDIVKPWPVHKFEKLPGGWGITLDDVAAGIMAAVTLWLMVAAYSWVHAWLIH